MGAVAAVVAAMGTSLFAVDVKVEQPVARIDNEIMVAIARELQTLDRTVDFFIWLPVKLVARQSALMKSPFIPTQSSSTARSEKFNIVVEKQPFLED